MKIKILDEARHDLIDGYRFYEKQSKGLGRKFVDSLFADIDGLHIHAGVHAIYYGHHRLLAKRFPYAVYYRLDAGMVSIHAVLDCRRTPLIIKEVLE